MHANIKLLFWKEDSYADTVTEFLWVIVSVQNVAVQNGKSVGCSFWTARPSNMSEWWKSFATGNQRQTMKLEVSSYILLS